MGNIFDYAGFLPPLVVTLPDDEQNTMLISTYNKGAFLGGAGTVGSKSQKMNRGTPSSTLG